MQAKSPINLRYTKAQALEMCTARREMYDIVSLRLLKGVFEFVEPQEIAKRPNFGQQNWRVAQVVDADSSFLKVDSDLRLEIAAPFDESPNSPSFGLLIRCRFRVEFRIRTDDQYTDGHEIFARINGLMITWPYWREFVSNCANRLEIEIAPTPLMTPDVAATFASFRNELMPDIRTEAPLPASSMTENQFL